MYRRTLLSILFFVLYWVAVGQTPLTDAQRREQQTFIKQDTLPVHVTPLPSSINSRFSEYAGNLYPDSTFLFTSMRSDIEEDYDHFFETNWYCKIYAAKYLGGNRYGEINSLPNIINNRNTFNSNFFYDYHAQTPSIIYSRCKHVVDGLQCELWESSKTDKGWAKPQKLPEPVNVEGSTSMQPFLVSYPNYKVLYFVSNRPNGVGGLDIWYSVYKDGKYNTPINAGTVINTEGNEVTPFYDVESSTLYFSSDEHIGIGDYDIFYSVGSLSQWGEVSNMGVPFNSEYNDFYYTTADGGKQGFFSSNRAHEGSALEDTCCNDLFHFEWTMPQDTVDTVEHEDTTLLQKIASVLPITLYFDNDQPNPRSVKDSTEHDYASLFRQYLHRATDYLQSSSVNDIEKTQITTFWQDSIETGFERLNRLTTYLKEALLSGEEITIHISGFASPLHNKDYNQHLSSRRIVSLLNYFRIAENGFFVPYLNGTKQGFHIEVHPQGAVNHTFRTDEVQETVYGVQAAKDRKIIIR